MNEESTKEENILDEKKTGDTQSEETHEIVEDLNENNADAEENIIDKLNDEIQELKDQRLRAS